MQFANRSWGYDRIAGALWNFGYNSFAERWVKSVKDECLSKLILFGEKSLRLVLNHYVSHHHHERNHQGKDNLLLFPAAEQASRSERPVQCRERLGGLLKFYYQKAA